MLLLEYMYFVFSYIYKSLNSMVSDLYETYIMYCYKMTEKSPQIWDR